MAEDKERPFGKLSYDAESLKGVTFDKHVIIGGWTRRRHPLLVALDKVLRREKRTQK